MLNALPLHFKNTFEIRMNSDCYFKQFKDLKLKKKLKVHKTVNEKFFHTKFVFILLQTREKIHRFISLKLLS